MTQQEMVKLLYRGGQVAILTELIVIAIMGVFFVSQADFIQHINQNDLALMDNLIDAYTRHPQIFVLLNTLLIPGATLLFLYVVQVWHRYFQWEGITFSHTYATHVALIGSTLMIAAYAVQLLTLSAGTPWVEQGQIQKETLYIGLLIWAGFLGVGNIFLYVIYPLFLAIILWQKKLFSRRGILIGVIIFVSFNGLSIILCPFWMGTLLLLKAQRMAEAVYTERQTGATI